MVNNSRRLPNLATLGLIISHLFAYHLGRSYSYVSNEVQRISIRPPAEEADDILLVTAENSLIDLSTSEEEEEINDTVSSTPVAAVSIDAVTVGVSIPKISKEEKEPARESSKSSLVSKFDEIRQMLYKKAISTSSKSSTNRTKFSLEGWNETNGGLDDADRITLGELYYNAESVFEFGLGESTLIAASTGVPRYSGIDSDPVWIAQARADSKKDHFRFNFGDIHW